MAFFGYGVSLAKDPLLYMTPGYVRTTDGFFVKLAYVFRRLTAFAAFPCPVALRALEALGTV